MGVGVDLRVLCNSDPLGYISA